MIAAILVAITGGEMRVPHHPVLVAQAVIGCMIARSIPPSIIGEILRDWPLFVAVVFRSDRGERYARLVAHALARAAGHRRRVGFVARRRLGNDADGGSLGADIRLVAFMQYLRVLLFGAKWQPSSPGYGQ